MTKATLQLSSMARAAWNEATARNVVLAEIEAAHKAGQLEAKREDYVLGSLARRLDTKAPKLTVKLMTLAYNVRHGGGVNGKKLKKGQTLRRDEAQELAYGCARKDWSRALADLGIGSVDKRGTKSGQTKARKAKAKTKPAKTVPASPKVSTIEQVEKHLRQHMAMLVTFASRNKDVLVGDHGAKITSLISEFVERVNKLS